MDQGALLCVLLWKGSRWMKDCLWQRPQRPSLPQTNESQEGRRVVDFIGGSLSCQRKGCLLAAPSEEDRGPVTLWYREEPP